MFDDNFGQWSDTHDPEVQAFYRKVQRTNVTKVCEDCGRTVRIQPHYAVCNSCAAVREQERACPAGGW